MSRRGAQVWFFNAWEGRAAACGPSVLHLPHERNTDMARFLFVYRNNSESYGNLSFEETQKVVQKWSVWIAEGLRLGWMVDAGGGLRKDGRVVNAKQVVSDGPHIDGKEIMAGYSVVEAGSFDAAVERAKSCPIIQRGGSVEIRPLHGFTLGQ
jgi:hypothetical protein